jgi:hypothetical protein
MNCVAWGTGNGDSISDSMPNVKLSLKRAMEVYSKDIPVTRLSIICTMYFVYININITDSLQSGPLCEMSVLMPLY